MKLPERDCCGCSACANICPKQCIKMIPDNEGFLYPEIDKEICVHCNLCVKTCPVLSKKSIDTVSPKAYAARNKNNNIVSRSSSGGIFSLLAEYMINSKSAIVWGAMFNDNWEVIHERIETVEDLEKLRGSKYVQSD